MDNLQLQDFICSGDISIVTAMQKISVNRHGILFITDKEQRLKGSLTDGDIRRWLVNTGNLKSPISKVMCKSPSFITENEKDKALSIMQSRCITALPVVTKGKVLQNIIFASESEDYLKKKSHILKDVAAVVMAGGKGTRLQPYTKILPKPLIPIGDVPILERIINSLNKFEINNYYITVNYKKGMIKSYFNDLNPAYSITYVEEEKPLGTAGSLKLIDKKFEKPVIVTNCDILIDADYEDIYKHHLESGNKLTIVSALKKIVIPYGVLKAGKNGVVGSIDEKPSLSYFINTGMYVLDPEVFDFIPDNSFFHMTDLADILIKNHYQVGMYPIGEDAFLDMGELEEMKRMENKLLLKEKDN